MEMSLVGWFWASVGVGCCWGVWWWRRRREEVGGERRRSGGANIPRGSMGWPLLGETLDFIASGYSSRPVSFMDKRRTL
ncbi:cytochrome P450 [Asimina triloba]